MDGRTDGLMKFYYHTCLKLHDLLLLKNIIRRPSFNSMKLYFPVEFIFSGVLLVVDSVCFLGDDLRVVLLQLYLYCNSFHPNHSKLAGIPLPLFVH